MRDMSLHLFIILAGFGIIRQYTYYFLLVVHCDYIAISYRFTDISTCLAHVTTRDIQ